MGFFLDFLKQVWVRFGPEFRKWLTELETKYKNEKIDKKNVEELKKDIEQDVDREKRKSDVGKLLNGSDS